MERLKHIPELAAVLKQQGVEHIIICPGSRNAPLIQAFNYNFPNSCHSLVDERSACYFALGLALKTKKPVVIITTSGTATLNLSPAIAEAFHQGVPLIVVTADRPAEWIDQQDNQSIRQQNIFSPNCKAFWEMPVQVNDENHLWLANRIANQAFNMANQGKKGPVHINVPLREPLYGKLPQANINQRIVSREESTGFLITPDLQEKWVSAKRIVVVVGQSLPDSQLNNVLARLADDQRVVVLAESISNLHDKRFILNPEAAFKAFSKNLSGMQPDLVIYIGGQIVSRSIKDYFRGLSSSEFWQISDSPELVDTFKLLTRQIKGKEVSVLNSFIEIGKADKSSDYSLRWKELATKSKEKSTAILSDISFSDFWIFRELSELVKPEDILFIGNSSVIRYMQYFKQESTHIYSNRGTSGIDGCVSTASGIASTVSQKVLAIMGDLSFIYDSNGLWNKKLSSNLKIIVINNKGGNIFGMIPGPSSQPGFEEFFEAHHPVSIQNLSTAFGLHHFMCTEADSFYESFHAFYASDQPAILEVQTDSQVNMSVFNNFVQKLTSNE